MGIEPGKVIFNLRNQTPQQVEITVSLLGPVNMNQADYRAAHLPRSPLIESYLQIMRQAANDGHANVRLTKKDQIQIFSCQFPRYRENGDWWPWESAHLALDDESLATDQMRFAGLIVSNPHSVLDAL